MATHQKPSSNGGGKGTPARVKPRDVRPRPNKLNSPESRKNSEAGHDDIEEEPDEEMVSQPLTARERKYLLAVERGNLATVKRFVEGGAADDEDLKKPGDQQQPSGEEPQENEPVNIDCTDPLGRSALVIAIENENIELLYYLLDIGVKPKDSLLHAIEEQYVEAVEILLDFEEATHKPGELYSWEKVDDKEASWTPDVTPLILAAHKNNYEILKILLDRGATLPMPHDVKCSCDECDCSSKTDSLRHSRSRINAYTALASPSLIALSSRDPLLTAFELSWELRRLSRVENEFQQEYTDLRRQVQKFAVDLLDHTRTSKELEIMLNYNPEDVFEREEEQHGGKMGLERLKLAIDYRQKEFVAHANVQQLLTSLWYDGMPGFRRKAMIAQGFEIMKIGATFPLFCFNYLLAPHSATGSKLKQPFIKFIVNSSSYMFFLFLLVIVSQRVENMAIRLLGTQGMVQRLAEWEKQDRGALPSYVESLIMFYVLGFVWAEVKQLWDAGGMLSYAQDMWNFVDFAMNFLYCAWIGLRVVSWFVVQRELAYGYDPYIPREKWDAWDPMLLSEGVFGAATIFSILRLVHIFSVNHHLGPLQISLGRMIYDIMKFFFFYILVIFAFGCGMNQLLWYYADIDRENCYKGGHLPDRGNADHSCDVWRRFANPFETSQSLFWASFGLIDLNNFELTGIKSFTRFWAMLMFGSYSTINVVVLLNLLIAMMSNSFSEIVKADVEWKFARSKLWISYFEDGGTVPPPFNVIPSPKSIRALFGCGGAPKKRESFRKKKRGEKEREHNQRINDDTEVTEDDVNEIKQEVSSFKYQLFDLMRQNNWKMDGVDKGEGGLGRRERTKERRLLKGFNIGLVEGVNFEVVADRGSSNALAKIIMKVTKRGSSKRNWNEIVAANAPKVVDQIGQRAEYQRRRTTRRGGSKLRRETVLPTSRGWRRVAAVAREGGFRGGRLNSFVIRRVHIPQRVETERRQSIAHEGWAKVGKLSDVGAFKRYDSEILRHNRTMQASAANKEPEAITASTASVGSDMKDTTKTTTTTTTTSSSSAPPSAAAAAGSSSSSVAMELMTRHDSQRSGILKSAAVVVDDASPSKQSVGSVKKRISFGRARHQHQQQQSLPPIAPSPVPPARAAAATPSADPSSSSSSSTAACVIEPEPTTTTTRDVQIEIEASPGSWPGDDEGQPESVPMMQAAAGPSSSSSTITTKGSSAADKEKKQATSPEARWKARDDAWL
ncbi:unnamed protein product [Notodromas monacha]|uniref:Transient receptor ion channel domain-containing protein n=1 Tax=Notodromas monacha TaxID=399045 RepID=A0A7R9GC95_9CRUS|nr:unnamed protein product [Notodromas monacha]CAG0917389.1 unnamed protein product [Notodromas monacha]